MSGQTPTHQGLCKLLVRRRVLVMLYRMLLMLFCFCLLMGELAGLEVKYLIQFVLSSL